MMKSLVTAMAFVFALGGAAEAQVSCPASDRAYAALNAQDYATALSIWRPCAEQGLASAQYQLGVLFERGRAVPQNYSVAARWYLLAANQGDVFAQNNIAFLYQWGRGVPRDRVLAYMWFNIASGTGDRLMSEVSAERRDYISQQMTNAEIAEAQRLAREWMAAHPN